MKKSWLQISPVLLVLLTIITASCNVKNSTPAKELINEIDLKRGAVISCSPAGQQFGSVDFETSCSGKLKQDFNLAISLLHSFEYDEAEKVFAKIIDEEPGCAMAYWGVAMSNFHPLWTPPLEAELKKGIKALEIAKSISQKSKREADYLEALSLFYKDWHKIDHHTRCINFEKAMEKLYATFPGDKEAAIFYALSLDASADPADKTFTNQKKAGAILNALYPNEPDHPGVASLYYSYL